MLETKIRIKIINETIISGVSLNEAKQLADMLEIRNAIPTILGNVSYTYSEIENVDG